MATDGETQGDKTSKRLLLMCTIRKKNAMSAQMLKVSLFKSRNGAPSRKRCVVNGQMTKASNK